MAFADEDVDGHIDFAFLVRFMFNNHIYNETFTKPFEQGGMPGEVDIPRLEQGLMGGALWSMFVPCPTNISDFSNENYAECKSFFLSYPCVSQLTHLQPCAPPSLKLTSTTASACNTHVYSHQAPTRLLHYHPFTSNTISSHPSHSKGYTKLVTGHLTCALCTISASAPPVSPGTVIISTPTPHFTLTSPNAGLFQRRRCIMESAYEVGELFTR